MVKISKAIAPTTDQPDKEESAEGSFDAAAEDGADETQASHDQVHSGTNSSGTATAASYVMISNDPIFEKIPLAQLLDHNDIGLFYELLLRQRAEYKEIQVFAEMAGKPQPPDLIAEVNKHAELQLKFSQQMELPADMAEQINESREPGDGRSLISLQLLPSDDDELVD